MKQQESTQKKKENSVLYLVAVKSAAENHVESHVSQRESHVRVKRSVRHAERRNLDVAAVNFIYFIIFITSYVSVCIKKIYNC